ncbi:protein MAIN-LIKE 1-like [Lycium barbarum]|uniref:protein MAIN-LIKE 1-like n=1 Tax=Lycium barbarum TaxID=112863 RepID=UPI00293EE12B|nr:protein MAIN-LIKE 1-like [Lycium barbarum]
MAMVEWWRPKTHTFHLYTGEAMIKLQDVEVMFGLRVDGDPLYSRAEPPPGSTLTTELTRLTHFMCLVPTTISGQSRVRISVLCQYLHDLPQTHDNTDQVVVDRHSHLYLLNIFGGILSLNISGAYVSLWYLIFLKHLDLLGDYS